MSLSKPIEALLSCLASEPVAMPLMVGAGLAAGAAVVLDVTMAATHGVWFIELCAAVAVAATTPAFAD